MIATLIDATCKLAANWFLHRLLCPVLIQQSATRSNELPITAHGRVHSTEKQNKHISAQLVMAASALSAVSDGMRCTA